MKIEVFKLEVTLGNEAMKEPADLAAALRRVADRLDLHQFFLTSGLIVDVNGNIAGGFRIVNRREI